MKEVYLYFRTVAVLGDDDSSADSMMFPLSRLTAMVPTADDTLALYFEPAIRNQPDADATPVNNDYVVCTIGANDHKDAITALSRLFAGAANGGIHHDGFIVVADDCTTTDSATSALDNLTIAAKYAHPSISGVASITVAAKSYAHLLPSMTSGGASTVVSNALELAVNTNYHSIAGNCAMTIPAAADGKAGDWITVRYITVITDGNTHSYTTTTDATFTAGSCVTRVGGGVASGVDVSDGSAKNILTLDGDTNGDCGIGTVVKFVNQTGTTDGWAVEALVLNQGNGSAAMAAATAFS